MYVVWLLVFWRNVLNVSNFYINCKSVLNKRGLFPPRVSSSPPLSPCCTLITAGTFSSSRDSSVECTAAGERLGDSERAGSGFCPGTNHKLGAVMNLLQWLVVVWICFRGFRSLCFCWTSLSFLEMCLLEPSTSILLHVHQRNGGLSYLTLLKRRRGQFQA